MTIYQTADEAKAAQAAQPAVVATIEIEHSIHGQCYINAMCTLRQLDAALAAKPIPEIRRLIRTVVDYRKYATSAPKPAPVISHGPGYCYNCDSYCYGDCKDYRKHYRSRR